jgi:thioredoxin-dependent peroxiredoxin
MPAAKKKPAALKAPARKPAAKKPAAGAPDKLTGKPAPDFNLPATVTGTVSRAALKGKAYVLYFYPKDDTSGCTAEACDFRDNFLAFKKLGVTVIGVSKDSLQRHEKFSKKYALNFPLASDEKSKMCEAFGVWVKKSMYGRKYMGIERSTFLIDAKGIVRKIWRKVSVTGHVAEVAKAVKDL